MAIVERFYITDEIGRVLTIDGLWSYDDGDEARFSDEDEAAEEAANHPGSTVERMHCVARRDDTTLIKQAIFRAIADESAAYQIAAE